MNMRADVERNVETGTDAYGHSLPPNFQPHTTLSCWVWSTSRREVIDGSKTVAVEDLRAMFPLGSDVDEEDEIAVVRDGKGNVIYSSRMKIGPPQYKHNHLEATLERVG